MVQMLGGKARFTLVTALCMVAAVAVASPISVYAADNNRGKHQGKHHGKNKQRMTICHYGIDGNYSEKSLPVRAAMKHLARHELDKEPVIGDDDSESCISVEEPPTTCRVPVDGIEYTVNEYLIAQNLSVAGFETSAGFCRLVLNDTTGTETADTVYLYSNADGDGLDIYFGVGNLNRRLIDSEEQYQDCAFDVETAALGFVVDIDGDGVDDGCPDLVQLND